MCDQSTIPSGKSFIMKAPPCEDHFRMILAADGKTPVKVMVDGEWFSVKPSKPGRMNLDAGERFFSVVETAHYVAIREAHRGMVALARDRGLLEGQSADSRLSPLSRLLAEMAKLERALDQGTRLTVGAAVDSSLGVPS